MSSKTFEMSFCALVEVECIMALYNKGRQTVLLSIFTSTKWQSGLERVKKQLIQLKHL